MSLSTVDFGSVDESARRRFESAWASGAARPIEEFLPPTDDPRRLATLRELVLIELEFTWKAHGGVGPIPPRRAEDYLARFPELNTPEIAELIARSESSVRQVRSSTVSVEDTVARDSSYKPVFEGYEIAGILGKGGMGIVYEARETQLGRTVALKIARAGSNRRNDSIRARFLAEARVSARLEHPGVVPVHELVTPATGEPFYTMKLVRGRTLSEAIRSFHTERQADGAIARLRLIESFLAVTRTMAFAHEKGVIHRDLKPANIVLGEFGETVILDWGIAKILGSGTADDASAPGTKPESPELTAFGDVLGTPAYMSPEQADGRIEEVDERSDIYSLGAILFHILIGSHPDVRRELDSSRSSLAGSKVPRPLAAICLKAMAKAKVDRYPSAKLLADDVERHLAGEPVSVYRERSLERAARWARRNRTLAAAGVVALVLSTIGIASGLYLLDSAAHDRREQALELENQQKQADQRIAFETEKQQTKEREAALRAAQNELARGLAELQSGRFADAEQTFQKGLANIPPKDDSTIRFRLEELHRNSAQLAAFNRYRERADRLALETEDKGWTVRDDAVVAACEAGLRNLGALDGEMDWWKRLPDAELTPELRFRLREDASASLGMLAMWHAKYGHFLNDSKQFDRAKQEYRAALNPLDRIQAHVRADSRRRSPEAERSSPAAATLANICRAFAGLPPQPAKLPLVAETAPDLYFLGITHLFIAFSQLDPRVLALMQALGLDGKTPLITAEKQLREAVTLDPGYHMAHYWLGRCLRQAQNYSAAEQAYNSCIALRPQYVPAYTARSASLLSEALTLKDSKPPRTRNELLDAAYQALAKAPESIRADPEIRWLETLCLSWLGRDGDAIAAAVDTVEKEIVQRHGFESGLPSMAAEALKFLKARQNETPDLHAGLASALFASRDEATAKSEADWVLARDAKHPRALAIRGMLRLKAGATAEALRDFDASLATVPNGQLAGAGRAWALESLGDWDAALKAHTRLLPIAVVGVGPQYLQPYLGQARCLEKLGRTTEAKKALEAAREIDPVAGDSLK